MSRFCKDIGINRQVFKTWIQNHKGGAATTTSTSNIAAAPIDNIIEEEGDGDEGCVQGVKGEEEVKGSASMEEEKEGGGVLSLQLSLLYVSIVFIVAITF